MGTIITYVLAVLIIGYGVYQFTKSLKEQTKGKCSGCSCDCDTCETNIITNITQVEEKK